MWLPRLFTLLGFSSQTTYHSPAQASLKHSVDVFNRSSRRGFEVKMGDDLLSPRDMLSLPRVGAGTVNNEGDLVLVPVSEYSFEERRWNILLFLCMHH